MTLFSLFPSLHTGKTATELCVSTYFLPLLVFRGKKKKLSYPEVPGNSHSLSKTWFPFLLLARKMQLYSKNVCILWILV